MPGFFESMKRIAQGKPMYDTGEPQDHVPQQQQSHAVEHQSLIQKGNDRTFPVVYVKRTTVRQDGSSMQVYAHILNTWPEVIELTKTNLLGQTHHIETQLRPNEEREFLIYKGPRPRNKMTEAQLEYKTHHEKDYFAAIHDVTFMYHDEDKTYSVDELRLRPPIRDIYG